jgi:hypothetical protein
MSLPLHREIRPPEVLPVAQQSNGYDCGVYTVMFAELFMQAMADRNSPDEVVLPSPDSIHRAVFTEVTPTAVTEYRLQCIRDIRELCDKHK